MQAAFDRGATQTRRDAPPGDRRPHRLRRTLENMTVTADASSLAVTIARLHAAGADADRDEARTVFAAFRAELSAGRIRAAEPDPASPTGWTVNAWVKQGILVGFLCGEIAPFAGPDPRVPFLDKDTLPLKRLDPSSRIRLVPGGSSIRARPLSSRVTRTWVPNGRLR